MKFSYLYSMESRLIDSVQKYLQDCPANDSVWDLSACEVPRGLQEEEAVLLGLGVRIRPIKIFPADIKTAEIFWGSYEPEDLPRFMAQAEYGGLAGADENESVLDQDGDPVLIFDNLVLFRNAYILLYLAAKEYLAHE
jgi:hypothetical protein